MPFPINGLVKEVLLEGQKDHQIHLVSICVALFKTLIIVNDQEQERTWWRRSVRHATTLHEMIYVLLGILKDWISSFTYLFFPFLCLKAVIAFVAYLTSKWPPGFILAP